MTALVRPPFETERLRAEPVEARHARTMAPILAKPAIREHLNGGPETVAELQRRYRFLEAGRSRDGKQLWLTWILLLHSGETIGFVESTVVEPELFYLAYVVGQNHQRRGYAREASSALVDLMFESFEVDKAVVEMDVPNVASVALAESLGFVWVRTVHEPEQRFPEHVYELTREQWAGADIG